MSLALVTGASRGVGRGVANALAAEKFQVYATARGVETADLAESVVRLRCDHTVDADTERVFERLQADSAEPDILVNSAWGGYERMVENGSFTWGVPFWQQPAHRWAGMMDAGVRAAFVMSAKVAPMMMRRRRGLIVNISFWPAQKYIGNAIYGISKDATDKMTADMAHELRPHGVSVISLYPGLVRTEAVMEAARAGWLNLSNSESPEFIGHVIAGLSRDPNLLARSGRALVAAQVARELGVRDSDGSQPVPLTIEDV